MNLSRSFSVRQTAFKCAPYADNETIWSQNCLYYIFFNIQPANVSNLNSIFHWKSVLRHIRLPNMDNRRIGVPLETSSVQFTHALEWIRGSPNRPVGLRTESSRPSPASLCIVNEKNCPFGKISSSSPQPNYTRTMVMSFLPTYLNNIGQLKQQSMNSPKP